MISEAFPRRLERPCWDSGCDIIAFESGAERRLVPLPDLRGGQGRLGASPIRCRGRLLLSNYLEWQPWSGVRTDHPGLGTV